MAFSPRVWLDTLRTVDRLLALEKNHRALSEKQADEIQEIKDRLTTLEAYVKAREEILVAEAKGAAAAVASTVASQHIAGIAQSLGRLQGRLDGSNNSTRLPPPTEEP